MQTDCPNCGSALRGADECSACGVVASKWKGKPPFAGVTGAADNPEASIVSDCRALSVEQYRREMTEIVLGLEQPNQYTITDERGRLRGYVVEQGRGLAAFGKRTLMGSHRPLVLTVFGPQGDAPVLELHRPFYLLFSDMTVKSASGRVWGRVERRFGLLSKRYELFDVRGAAFAKIAAGPFRIWTFPVTDMSGRPLATIGKKWSGLMQEYWTDADRFGITFDSPSLTVEQKLVLLATALTIDFDFFENNQKR